MKRAPLLWLGWSECLVGLLIVVGAGWLMATHARNVGRSVDLLASRSHDISGEIDQTAAMLEDHRDLVRKIRTAVAAYEQNVFALRQASDDVARQAAAWRALSGQVGSMFTDLAHLTDRIALAFNFKVPTGVTWKNGPQFTFSRPLGSTAEAMHEEARTLFQLGLTLTKTADVTLTAVEKTHASMAVSSDETAAALADIRELLTKIEKERVAAWVEQVRRAGRDIDRAGHNLDSVQPLAMGLTSGALLAGVFCTLNGVAILMFARHLLPPGERRREAGAAMTLAPA